MGCMEIGVAVAFFVAGTVKGIAGMGLPTVALGLLGLMMPMFTAATLLVVPSLATNTAQCAGPYFRRLARFLSPMWLGIVIGTIFTPFPKLATAGGAARIGLGILLVVYSVYGLARPAFRLRLGPRPMLAASSVVGLVTGAMAAATGVNFFPMIIFLQSLHLERDEMVQALGLSFAVSTVSLAVSLGFRASWDAATSLAGLLALVSAFAGMAIGARLRRRTPAASFRKLLFVMFGILGTVMIGFEVGGSRG